MGYLESQAAHTNPKNTQVHPPGVERSISPVVIDGENIKVVERAKHLGFTISKDPTWNAHRSEVIKKASKRLYFLTQLKKANVSETDLSGFYTACIRSVRSVIMINYAGPAVFHYSLPK